MAKKKQSGRGRKAETVRSRAAVKGWQTRRQHERKRHEAAIEGWKTRRKKYGPSGIPKKKRPPAKKKPPVEKKPPPPPKVSPPADVVTRTKYKPKQRGHGPKIRHVEIVSRGALKDDLSNVKQVTVGQRVYTRRQDIEALSKLIKASLA